MLKGHALAETSHIPSILTMRKLKSLCVTMRCVPKHHWITKLTVLQLKQLPPTRRTWSRLRYCLLVLFTAAALHFMATSTLYRTPTSKCDAPKRVEEAPVAALPASQTNALVSTPTPSKLGAWTVGVYDRLLFTTTGTSTSFGATCRATPIATYTHSDTGGCSTMAPGVKYININYAGTKEWGICYYTNTNCQAAGPSITPDLRPRTECVPVGIQTKRFIVHRMDRAC